MYIKGMWRNITGMVFALTPIITWSVTEPIDFIVKPRNGFPATTILGGSYSFEYILINNFSFDQKLKQVSYTISSRGGFNVTDSCSNKTLTANGGTCTMSIVFQPVEIGTSSIKFTLHYDNNTVPLPTLSTHTIQQSVPCSENTGEVPPVPLNPNTLGQNAEGWVANCPFGYNLVCKSESGAINALCLSGEAPREGDFSKIFSVALLNDELSSEPFPNNIIPTSRIPPTCTFPGPAAVAPVTFPNSPNKSVCVACNAFNCPMP